MKQLFFVTALLFSLMAQSFAYDFESGNLLYSIINTDPPQVCLEGSAEGTAFQGELIIPDAVTYEDINYSVTAIAPYAFWHCERLTSLYVPATVTNIGDGNNPFVGTINLETIFVDLNNPVYESNHSEGNCIVKVDTLVVGCNNTLIPGTVKVIGKDAFACCLTQMPVIPPYVKVIGQGAFAECKDPNPLVLPNSIERIEYLAFAYCRFSNVFIPSSVITIEPEAFGYNDYLQELVLSETVSWIDDNAFCYVPMLNKIYSFNPEPPRIGSFSLINQYGSSAFPYANPDMPIYVPQESIEIYRNAEGWSGFTNFQPLPCWDGTVAEQYAGGDGTPENPYQIATPQQLALLARQTNNGVGQDLCYELTDDICLNLWLNEYYYDWSPIGEKGDFLTYYFRGRFDGKGKTISGLVRKDQYMNGEAVMGLFGYTDGAEICNVNISHSKITGNKYTGGLVAMAQRTTITNCNVEDAVVGFEESPIFDGLYSGGVVGFLGEPWPDDKTADSSYIRNCHIASTVTVKGNTAGGIVGCVNSSISREVYSIVNCENKGTVYSTKWCAGGIVGELYHAKVADCVNEGAVTADRVEWLFNGGYAGGVVGILRGSNVNGCVNVGVVEGNNSSGGIVALVLNDSTDGLYVVRNCHNKGAVVVNWSDFSSGAAGIVGNIQADSLTRFYIIDCSNHGNVDVQGYCAAGIIGNYTPEDWNGLGVFNVFNKGNVSSAFASGILSRFCFNWENSGEIRIRNAYNTGTINEGVVSQQPVIVCKVTNVNGIGDCYWLYDEHYCGNDGNPLKESCAFRPRLSSTQWRLDSIRYNTADLLRALNAGAEHLENLYPDVGQVSRWQKDVDGVNDGFPMLGEKNNNDTLVFPFVGSEWYYEILNDNGNLTYQHLEYAADTTINNERTKVVVRTNQIYDKNRRDEVSHEYIFEEDDIVYWWNKERQEFTVLYDFGAVEGDEWTITVGNEKLIMHVDVVEQYEYDGHSYRMLRVSDEQDFFSGNIVCGIGHLTSFFPERLMSQNRSFRVDGIRCYWHDGTLVFQYGDKDCDEVYLAYHHGINEPLPESYLQIYPNPTDGLLHVKTYCGASQPLEYRITNLLGQTVLSGVLDGDSIDVSVLSKGIYILGIDNTIIRFIVSQ